VSTPAYSEAAEPEDAGAHSACTSFVTVPYAKKTRKRKNTAACRQSSRS
jgi:hypothetical protein